jgi:hypothetical protein
MRWRRGNVDRRLLWSEPGRFVPLFRMSHREAD